MIKLLKESYGDLSDYLERHLDSWYGRLNELGDDIENLGLDVDKINNEYVIVHATEPDGEDAYCKIRLGGTPRTISLETFEMLESVGRSKNVLRESDDKITARSFQELISKLEDHGYSCEHYYDMKYPESNWLYITKNGDPYEAEFYRYSDGEYELYLHNIHPTKRRNESMKRRKQVKENLYRVWYNPYLLEPGEEDCMEVTAESEEEARRRVSSSGYVTYVEEIESKTDPYDESVSEEKEIIRTRFLEHMTYDYSDRRRLAESITNLVFRTNDKKTNMNRLLKTDLKFSSRMYRERIAKCTTKEELSETLSRCSVNVLKRIKKSLVRSLLDESNKEFSYRIDYYGSWDNGHVLHSFKKATLDRAEEDAKTASIKDPKNLYYVVLDDIMNPTTGWYYYKGKAYSDSDPELNSIKRTINDSKK